MKVGLIGAGRIGALHARTLRDHSEVSALRIADVAGERAAALAAQTGAEVASTNEELADWADALVITAATSAHADLIHLAADAGIAAFCEKPIALDLETTDGVLEHVERAGILLQIGFQRRFDVGFREARRLVQAGDLGRLYIVRLATHDPEPSHEEYISTSGGIFRDLHIHDFDAVRWVTGQEVEEVYAMGAVLCDDVFKRYDDVDTAAAVLRLRDGALAILSGTRHDPRGYDVRMELFGARDSIAVGWDGRTPLRSVEPGVPAPAERAYPNFLDRFAAAYEAELAHFIEFAQGRAENLCPGDEAREALRISEAAALSLAEGRPVRLEEIGP
ncbi:MAG: Gfo/Idh/MocA family oxidoreductase [Dehalococcoidia bacterium]